ncbi:transmembrane protease serine 12-like [Branchiostoma floridae]|uniref:chitinase n=1 Tax=Branchiostoma floridae TaxID=7739 RepID=A0A9J7KUW0_BRAFL|nr:transmembrane protease serine 12-like [Branchiostoma floridae]
MSIKLATVVLVSVAFFASSSSAKPAPRNARVPPIWSCAGGHGLHPDPEDCGRFYQCAPGHRPFHQSCPAGLHFDPVLLVCNWPGSLTTPCAAELEMEIPVDEICPVPIPPSHGTMAGSDVSIGATYTFSCHHGYQLQGASSITCTEEGWSAEYPICHPIRCGVPAVRSKAASNKIVGGHEVVPGSQPWMVSFQHPLYPLQNANLCGGSLIAPTLIVTAAHCFRPLNKPQTGWVAHLAEHNLYEDEGHEQNITVKDIIVHENFVYDVLTNDIALVRLSRPANMDDWVSPICLPEEGEKVEEDTLCTTSGWGYTKPLALNEYPEGELQSAVLQEIELPVVSNRKCATKLPDYEIYPEQMCAGYDEGGIDTCVGDSGGPLACKDDVGRMTIQGITSYGDKGTCAQPAKPGVYSRVSSFVSWIHEHVTEQEWAVIRSYV